MSYTHLLDVLFPGPYSVVRPSVLMIVAVILAYPAHAQTCTVPGTHGAIQEAVDDAGCATIDLLAQTYTESVNIPRSLTLSGPGGGGAVVEGLVQVTGGGTQVSLQDLRVENGCAPNAVRSVGGAEVAATNLEVERSASLPCPTFSIFLDGFESGDTSAWSSTGP